VNQLNPLRTHSLINSLERLKLNHSRVLCGRARLSLSSSRGEDRGEEATLNSLILVARRHKFVRVIGAADHRTAGDVDEAQRSGLLAVTIEFRR